VGYLPGLDGLRAISVLAVILFHAGVTGISGGFLGVEVFFVISGYLITSLLLAEHQETGRISLRGFWIRRARRLLPALYVLLAVVAAVTLVFFPDDAAALRGDVVAALLYVINWFFIVTQKSYFEVIGRPPVLQHLWSLAVEEQFYLLWPLLFGFGMKVLTRKRMLVCILAGALASAVLMAVLYTPGTDASRVYYGTDTRAQGLLMGAALAFVWAPWRLHRRTGKGAPVVLDLAGIAGLAVLAWVFVSVNEYRSADALYRGGFFALDVLTVVLIAVTVHPAARLVPAVLGSRPLRWVGQRSYGLYLWHWPIFVITRPGLDVDLDGPALFVLRMALTVAFTEVSYRFIEQPVRHGALGRAWTRVRAAGAPARARAAFGGALAVSILAVVVLGVGLAGATKPAPPEFLAMADQTIPGLPTAGEVPGTLAGGDTTVPVGPEGSVNPNTPGDTTADRTAPDASSLPATTAPPPPTTQAPLVPPSMAGQPMSAVGDSVMLGASGAIRQVFGAQMGVDATVGRQATEAIGVLQTRYDFGSLGNLVIIHIGNNGYVTLPQCQKMLDIVADVPRVLLVTVKVPREWEGEVNSTIDQCAQGRANTVVVDWHAASVDHPEFFYDDGMHLQQPGAIAYVSLLANAAG
jgi:peptidoglycan/LPS O-acetylase OafA/YrhL